MIAGLYEQILVALPANGAGRLHILSGPGNDSELALRADGDRLELDERPIDPQELGDAVAGLVGNKGLVGVSVDGRVRGVLVIEDGVSREMGAESIAAVANWARNLTAD